MQNSLKKNIVKFVVISIPTLAAFFLFTTPLAKATDPGDWNAPCSIHSDCYTGTCAGGTCFCEPPNRYHPTTGQCTVKEAAGVECQNSYECISGNCDSSTHECAAGGAGMSQSCGNDADCALGDCAGGRCVCGARGVCELREGETPTTPIEDVNKLKKIRFETVPALINFYMRGTLAIVGIWALLFFIYAGILWLTSGGSPDKIKKAQQIMVWATIGIVVIFASYAIVSQVITAVGG